MMALLELPALRDFAASGAGAKRLHELLRSRFKVEVRRAAVTSNPASSETA